MRRITFVAVPSFLAALVALIPTVAFGHHPTDFQLIGTSGEGLLSGIGHPYLGIDHLVFVVAASLLLAHSGLITALRGAAILSSSVMAGVALSLLTPLGMLAGLAESLIGLSIIAVAALLFRQTAKLLIVYGALVLSGLAHGYAYGQPIIGAEATPIVWYLIGLTISHMVMIALFVGLVRKLPLLTTYKRAIALATGGVGVLITALSPAIALAHDAGGVAHVHGTDGTIVLVASATIAGLLMLGGFGVSHLRAKLTK